MGADTDTDIDDLLSRRRQALRAETAERKAAAPSIPTYPVAHRALGADHFHGLLLLAGAETTVSATSRYEPWIPAALAVDYLDAFAHTHRREIRSVSGGETEHGRDASSLSTGILAGDLLFTRAQELLLEVDAEPATQVACVRTMAVAGRRICETASRYPESVDIEAYGEVLERHGGSLTMASTKIGGLLGDSSETQVARLADFGRNLGAALQLYTAADVNATESSSIGSAPRVVPECVSETAMPRDATRALRRRAERRISAARQTLNALPGSTGKLLLDELADRARASRPSSTHG